MVFIGYYADRAPSIHRLRAVLEAQALPEGAEEGGDHRPRSRSASRTRWTPRDHRRRRNRRQRRGGFGARLPARGAGARGSDAGGRQARPPPGLLGGRAHPVRQPPLRRRAADVHGPALPGAAGQVCRRQHGGQQRGLLRHSRPDARALERPDGLDAGIDPKRFGKSFQRCASGFRSTARRAAQAPAGRRHQDGGGNRKLGLDGQTGCRRREHQGLPRIGLLQHRLCLRQEALCPRQHPAACAAEFPGACGSSANASPRGSRPGAAARPPCLPAQRRQAAARRRQHRRRFGWSARLEPAPTAQRPGRRAGTGLCFNVGAPLTADFEEELNSFDGLQITHGYRRLARTSSSWSHGSTRSGPRRS